MQTDLCNELCHAQSTIVLYTKMDAECDQQVTVVGRLLTSLIMSFEVLQQFFFKFRVWDKAP